MTLLNIYSKLTWSAKKDSIAPQAITFRNDSEHVPAVKRPTHALVVCVLLATLFNTAPAAAQDADEGVVVSATRTQRRNLDIPASIAVPAIGIYAGWYDRPDGRRWPAAISVGKRPTFYGAEGELLVEAYLLDFSGDLYGEEGRLSFVGRLRPELAFDSAEELVAQIRQDVDATRALLSEAT